MTLDQLMQAERADAFDRWKRENSAPAVVSSALVRPLLFTLCPHCNQEFQIVFDSYISFIDCPHCSKRVDIWLRMSWPNKELTSDSPVQREFCKDTPCK